MLKNKGQSIFEYTAMAMLIIVGVIVMGPYITRSLGAHFKLWQESVDDSVNDRMQSVPINITPDCVCSGDIQGGCGGHFQRENKTCAPNERYHSTKCSPPACGFGEDFTEGCTPDVSCCEIYNACSLTTPLASCCGTTPFPVPADPTRTNPDAQGFPPIPGADPNSPASSCYSGEELLYNQCDTTIVRCKPNAQCKAMCTGNLPHNQSGDLTANLCPGADQGLTKDTPITLIGGCSVPISTCPKITAPSIKIPQLLSSGRANLTKVAPFLLPLCPGGDNGIYPTQANADQFCKQYFNAPDAQATTWHGFNYDSCGDNPQKKGNGSSWTCTVNGCTQVNRVQSIKDITCTYSKCSTPYTLVTPLCSGSETVSCNSGDSLFGSLDTGTGNNHTIAVDGNTCTASEGNNNNGVCGCQITCSSPFLITKKSDWKAHTAVGYASSYIYLSTLPPQQYTVAGQAFSVYDPIKSYRNGGATAITNLNANYQTIIPSLPETLIKNQSGSRIIFNYAQLASESLATQQEFINNLKTGSHVIANRYLCTTNTVDAPDCHVNNRGADMPAFEIDGLLYDTIHDSDTYVQFAEAETIGQYTLWVDGCTTFSTPGSTNWTVPAGVTNATVEVWGAGGGGGGWYGDITSGGGGGGGGGYSKGTLSLTGGTTYNIVIGAGGHGGDAVAPSDGGTSSFSLSSPLLQASGGHHGDYQSFAIGDFLGGAGGAASVDNAVSNPFSLSGSRGNDGIYAWGNGGDGGKAGGSDGGIGGTGGPGGDFNNVAHGAYGSGSDGTAPGGGGGGGGGDADIGGLGGFGANGMVKICPIETPAPCTNTCPDYATDPTATKCVAKCNDGYEVKTDLSGITYCAPSTPNGCNATPITALVYLCDDDYYSTASALASFGHQCIRPSDNGGTVCTFEGSLLGKGDTGDTCPNLHNFPVPVQINDIVTLINGLQNGKGTVIFRTINTNISCDIAAGEISISLSKGVFSGTTDRYNSATHSFIAPSNGYLINCAYDDNIATTVTRPANCNPSIQCNYSGTYYGTIYSSTCVNNTLSITCLNNMVKGFCVGSSGTRGTVATEDCTGCNWSGNRYFNTDRDTNNFTMNCSNNAVQGFWAGDHHSDPPVTGCNWSGDQVFSDCGDGNDIYITCTNGTITKMNMSGTGRNGCQWGPAYCA